MTSINTQKYGSFCEAVCMHKGNDIERATPVEEAVPTQFIAATNYIKASQNPNRYGEMLPFRTWQ